MNCKITHLQTCAPDYFVGNGDRPTAVVSIDGSTTIGEIITCLDDDDWGLDWSELSEEHAVALMRELERMRAEYANLMHVTYDYALDTDGDSPMFAHFGAHFSENMIADQTITTPVAVWTRCDQRRQCDPRGCEDDCEDYWRWEVAQLALARKQARELPLGDILSKSARARHRRESGELSQRGDDIEDAADTYCMGHASTCRTVRSAAQCVVSSTILRSGQDKG